MVVNNPAFQQFYPLLLIGFVLLVLFCFYKK